MSKHKKASVNFWNILRRESSCLPASAPKEASFGILTFKLPPSRETTGFSIPPCRTLPRKYRSLALARRGSHMGFIFAPFPRLHFRFINPCESQTLFPVAMTRRLWLPLADYAAKHGETWLPPPMLPCCNLKPPLLCALCSVR
jgi:hypothetical protein